MNEQKSGIYQTGVAEGVTGEELRRIVLRVSSN